MAFSTKAGNAPWGFPAPLLALAAILAVSGLLAFSLVNTSSFLVLGGLIGFIFMVACFLSPELGVAVLIMSMLLSPEIGIGGGDGSSVEGSRSIVIRIDDILLIILSVSWFARTAIHKDLGLIIANPLNRPIAFYVLSCAISTLIGYMLGDVNGKIGIFFVLRYIEYFIAFFITMNILDSREKMRRFIGIAIFTSICIAIYGMYQIPSGVRVSAPFEGDHGEPNTMGGYLLLLMCMAAGQLVTTKRTRALVGWSVYIFLLFIPLLFTGSRASWLGIPAVLLALFLFSPKKKQIALFTICIIVVGPTLLPKAVKERLLFTFMQQKQVRAKQLQIGSIRLDTSSTARLQSYNIAVDGWMKKPILGWGITGFVFVDSQIVRTLVETGIIGLLAFLWLTWSYFQGGIAAMRASPDRFQYGIAIGYIAGLFGLLAHSIGSNTFIILRIMEPWMVLTAIVIRIPIIQAEREKLWPVEETSGPELPEAPEEKPREKQKAVLSRIVRSGHALNNPADDHEEDDPNSKARFRKKNSAYEAFLVREEQEIKRRTIEKEHQEEINQPKFRKPIARKKMAPEKPPLTPPARATKHPSEGRPSLTRAAPPSETAEVDKKPVSALRAIDLARGAPIKKEKDADKS